MEYFDWMTHYFQKFEALKFESSSYHKAESFQKSQVASVSNRLQVKYAGLQPDRSFSQFLISLVNYPPAIFQVT